MNNITCPCCSGKPFSKCCEPYVSGKISLGYGRWPEAMRRLTAGTILDLTADPRVGKYLMFYHMTAGGPHEHIGGCSLGIAWSDDLVTWDWPGKDADREKEQTGRSR